MRRFLPSLCLLAGLLLGACGAAPEGASPEAASPRYVGGAVCAGCHAAEAAAWAGSDHDRAMAPATAETVLGDFDGTVFTSQGIETRFFRDGDRYLVRTEGPDGRPDTFEVAYTFGHRPLQQYLVAFPGGRLQALTVAWDTERKRWYSLYPDARVPPGDFVHWTGKGMNWNHMCAACHSTGLEQAFDLATETYRTAWSDVDVSCEACHGPGAAHVEWARAAGERAPAAGLPARLNGHGPARWQVEPCAPCHARRRVVAPGYTPGDDVLDRYTLELLDDERLYFADGQMRDEVFEYGSFLQSKMYQRGVRCTDCHDPHTARPKREGNALCTTCHAATVYDTPTHHFHEAGGAASACVACHMPARTYMGVDARRDHSFKVPRPDLAAELGVPDACTGCHADRPARWAAERVTAWYGPARRDSLGYARAVDAGRRHAAGADTALAAIARNADAPAVLRASALALLAGYDTPVATATARLLVDDPEPLVRLAALRAFEQAGDGDLVAALAPRLADTTGAVRVEAARLLARAGRAALPAAYHAAFDAALDAYRRAQSALADQPEAHLNLAVLHEYEGAPERAEAAYRTALRLDSTFVPARLNLALLFDRRRTAALQYGRADEAQALRDDAERHLRAALRLAPDAPEAHFSLGLLLAEDAARLPEAAAHLREAAQRSPRDARIQYNAGLAHQHLGDAAAAEALLLAAYRLDPRHADYLYALSVFYAQQRRWQEALRYTDALLDQQPGTPALVQQRAYLLRQMQPGAARP